MRYFTRCFFDSMNLQTQEDRGFLGGGFRMVSDKPKKRIEHSNVSTLPSSSSIPVVSSVSERQEGVQSVKHRSIYLLPNLFTTGALFSGFYAIVAGMNGDYINAAIAIFIAMILDGMDGRIARLTNSSSEFGAQFDSLSDMVAFGVAPALVTFSWSLSSLGKIGWIAAFVYVAGAALRLARFNVQISKVDRRYFIGFPSPAAAALVAGMIWALAEVNVDGKQLDWFAAIVVASTGMMMVSNFKYYSFKEFDLRRSIPFVALLAIVLVFVVVSIDPAKVLLGGFLVYALSGPARTCWIFYKIRRNRLSEYKPKK